jgi:hypothetical protein
MPLVASDGRVSVSEGHHNQQRYSICIVQFGAAPEAELVLMILIRLGPHVTSWLYVEDRERSWTGPGCCTTDGLGLSVQL